MTMQTFIYPSFPSWEAEDDKAEASTSLSYKKNQIQQYILLFMKIRSPSNQDQKYNSSKGSQQNEECCCKFGILLFWNTNKILSSQLLSLALLLMILSVTKQQQQHTSEVTFISENDPCKEDLSSTIITASEQIYKAPINKKGSNCTTKRAAEYCSKRSWKDRYCSAKFTKRNTTEGGYMYRLSSTGLLSGTVSNMSWMTAWNHLAYFLLQIMIWSNCSAKTGLLVYEIKDPCVGDGAFNYGKIYIRCDMEMDHNGGWIVIQWRISNGTVNFTQNWEDYENGFGDLDGEFWIGHTN